MKIKRCVLVTAMGIVGVLSGAQTIPGADWSQSGSFLPTIVVVAYQVPLVEYDVCYAGGKVVCRKQVQPQTHQKKLASAPLTSTQNPKTGRKSVALPPMKTIRTETPPSQ